MPEMNSKPFYDAKSIAPSVLFTPTAWEKIEQIYKNFYTNVVWFGLVKKVKQKEWKFIVYDIAIPPQNVNVNGPNTIDWDRYSKWYDDMKIRWNSTAHTNVSDEMPPLYLFGSLYGYGPHLYNTEKKVAYTASFTKKLCSIENEIENGIEEDGFFIFMDVTKHGEMSMRIVNKKFNKKFSTNENCIDVDICKMPMFRNEVLSAINC